MLGVKDRQEKWISEMRAALDGPLLWLGVMVGVVSAISAVARLFDVGLAGLFLDFVNFYRELLAPIHWLLNQLPLPFEVPELAIDFAALYAVLVWMGVRSEPLSPTIEGADDREEFILSSLGSESEATLILGRPLRHTSVRTWLLSLLLVPVARLSPVFNYLGSRRFLGGLSGRHERDHRALAKLRRGFFAFIAVPLGVAIFFLLNAYTQGMA